MEEVTRLTNIAIKANHVKTWDPNLLGGLELKAPSLQRYGATWCRGWLYLRYRLADPPKNIRVRAFWICVFG